MNKLAKSLLVVALLLPMVLQAQNPISPAGVYIADPTARVDKDGRLYIYGSRDENPSYYCSNRYHVLSSANLMDWTLYKDAFRNPETLYAPDMLEKDGVYHLYYCTPDGSEYVAVTDKPAGPFRDGVKIDGPQQIDPNIFIDDDGQAYYFWGQFSAKGARMNPDLKTLDWSTYVDGIVTEKGHWFHEGSFVFRRGKYYYYTYADISRNGRPTSIGYAMAESPLGPYTYKGVIVDNAGCDPATWNNHGSLVEFNGRWYVLYHRSTHGCNTMRKACIEPITFNEDGTINEVEMTSQGAGGPLRADEWTDAARACRLRGNVRIVLEGEREILDQARGGDAAVWKYLDFGEGHNKVTLKARSEAGARIRIRSGSRRGVVIGMVNIPSGGEWTLCSASVVPVNGVHTVTMEFIGESSLDSFRFE